MNIGIVFLVILMQAAVLHSTDHGHSHDVEAPHFKYSREANEVIPFFTKKDAILL